MENWSFCSFGLLRCFYIKFGPTMNTSTSHVLWAHRLVDRESSHPISNCNLLEVLSFSIKIILKIQKIITLLSNMCSCTVGFGFS